MLSEDCSLGVLSRAVDGSGRNASSMFTNGSASVCIRGSLIL